MKRKFVILNNGLRDHRGHYFETSISIAEAARRAGLHPVLATHVDCRTDLLPTWLESYPIFCTDHWMSEPAAAEPDLNGVALDPYATSAAAPSLASRLLRRSGWACRKAAWLAERSVYYLLPPLVYDGIELTSRLAIPRILRPESRARVAGRVRQILHRLRHGGAAEPLHFGPCPPEMARSLAHPFDAPLSPDDYYALVSRADVVLLPYDRNRYRACSSGTLAEAIAGGRPVVVPASSWMSSQIPLGAGETFHDFESFVEAVKRLVENYEAYRGKAQAQRAEWVANHAPDRLVAALTGEEPQVGAAEVRIAA